MLERQVHQVDIAVEDQAVDQPVDAAVLFECRPADSIDAFLGAAVRFAEFILAALRADELLRLMRFLIILVVAGHDLRAFAAELDARALAQVAGAAHRDDDLVFQSQIHVLSSLFHIYHSPLGHDHHFLLIRAIEAIVSIFIGQTSMHDSDLEQPAAKCSSKTFLISGAASPLCESMR